MTKAGDNNAESHEPNFVSLAPYEGDEWVRLVDSIGEPHPIVDVLTHYISSIACIRDMSGPIFNLLEERYLSAESSYSDLRGKFLAEQDGGSARTRIPRHYMPPSKQTKYLHTRRAFDDANYARRDLPNLFLLGLVSDYDAFLAGLIRSLFGLRPKLIASIDRTLSISDLLNLDSLEHALSFIIEKEVETALRDSHTEQLAWLERRFSVSTLRSFDSLKYFIEITERRNLVAHNAGVITNRYLVTCKKNGLENLDEMTVGSKIEISSEYIEHAYRVLFQVGVKLAHVLWRKVRPDQMGLSDKVLSRTCYTLLVFEEYDLAKELLTFAVELPRHSSEHEKRIFVINLAQCCKWLGEDTECRHLLTRHDWSASDDAFMLANHVLNDDFAEAARLMRALGANGDVPEAAFQDWPLFREFRKSKFFAPAYEDVFGHPYIP
ncbi:hypothetical protein ACFVYG_23880 [Streptomyces sp. NPDC058256]|uniref:hypothetical protein n=1 Tax=Streptomyces sp. NPDC058256 TaxID=3346408 RepID=UPI0036E7B558